MNITKPPSALVRPLCTITMSKVVKIVAWKNKQTNNAWDDEVLAVVFSCRCIRRGVVEAKLASYCVNDALTEWKSSVIDMGWWDDLACLICIHGRGPHLANAGNDASIRSDTPSPLSLPFIFITAFFHFSPFCWLFSFARKAQKVTDLANEISHLRDSFEVDSRERFLGIWKYDSHYSVGPKF